MTDDKDVAQLGEELVLSSSDDEIPEGESSPKHVPCSASVPPQPLSSNPEAFASQLLKKPWLEASDVLQLFEMLPMAAPQRGTEGKAFATGAFARVKVGLRTNVAVFPQASRVFASFVRQSAPGHKFTSVVVFEGVRTKPHRDQQNSCVPNLVVPLSRFEKGEIWVATDSGTVSRQVNGQQQKGVLLPVGAGPVLFDARRALHLTEPWKGRRVVLVAFSIGAFSRLSAEASARLSALQSPARQPRGRRIPPVMPEFKRVLVYQVAALPQVDHKRRLLQPLRDAPAGSKLISSTSLLSEVGLSSASETTVQADALVVDSSSSESGDTVSPVGPDDQASACFEVSLGVYASPEEFVEECLNVEHPFDQLHAAPDVLKQCLFDMLTKGPAWVVDRRAKLLKKWTQWARDLEAEEAGLRKSLDPEVAKVLQGKRLLLLEKIASSIGWVDMGVFAELRKGFDLVGHAKHTGVFALEPRPPKLPKDDFLAATKFLRPALLGKVKSSSVDRNARELWEKTMQESAVFPTLSLLKRRPISLLAQLVAKRFRSWYTAAAC